MKNPVLFICAAVSSAAFSLASTSSAQTLFEDNFDSGLSEFNWMSRLSGADAFADFAFDYSTIGIPAAPHSTGGTTMGMRFLVNQSAGAFQGISASPIGQSFEGDFKIQFDLWLNFVGPFPAGGSGSTQMASFGWGTNGNTVQWAGANHSILFAGSGDGGTSQDYRVYRAAGGAPMLPDTGVYMAGTLVGTTANPGADSRNNTDPYYASLGGEVAPAAQTTAFPKTQTGTTAVGTLGMAWRDVVIEKSGNVITWSVDGLPIVSLPIDGINLGGSNITFGMFDINDSSSADPNDFLNTAIYDNIRVTAVVPEPSSLSLLGGVAVAGFLSRRRRR